jgi:hypothetical protein
VWGLRLQSGFFLRFLEFGGGILIPWLEVCFLQATGPPKRKRPLLPCDFLNLVGYPYPFGSKFAFFASHRAAQMTNFAVPSHFGMRFFCSIAEPSPHWGNTLETGLTRRPCEKVFRAPCGIP